MKKILCVLMTAAIIICTCVFSAGAVVSPDTHMADISARLQEKLADGSTDTVEIALNLYDYSGLWERDIFESVESQYKEGVDYTTFDEYQKLIEIETAKWIAQYNYQFICELKNEQTPVEKVILYSHKDPVVVVEAKKANVQKIAKEYIDVESMDIYDGIDSVNPFKADFEAWTYKNHRDIFENYLAHYESDDLYTYTDLYMHNKDGRDSDPDWVLCEARYNAPEPEMMTVAKIGGIGGRTVTGTSIGSPFITGYGVFDVEKNEYYDLAQFADNNCSIYTSAKKLPFDSSHYKGLTEAMKQLNIGYATGDGNNDNSVDVLDAALIQKAASEKAYIDWQQRQTLDVNNDNKVDILDANLIQKYAATVD